MFRMTRTLMPMTLAVVLICGFAPQASADMIEKSGRFGGLQVTYKVVLPAGYDAARTYPVVLVFTGGAQQGRQGSPKKDRPQDDAQEMIAPW